MKSNLLILSAVAICTLVYFTTTPLLQKPLFAATSCQTGADCCTCGPITNPCPCQPTDQCCASWWTCFPAGTKVSMGDNQRKNIEGVRIGDKVISQSEEGRQSISTVTEIETPTKNHMCRLTFETGDVLRLSKEHPLMTNSGWKSIDPQETLKENSRLVVGKFEVGDRVTKEGGQPSVLANISCWSEQISAYNLILAGGAHTYFADGYLAHNKGGGGTCSPQAPATPMLTSPLEGAEIHAPGSTPITLDWEDVTDWGKRCTVGLRGYAVCAGPLENYPCQGQQIAISGSLALFPTPHQVNPISTTSVIIPKGLSFWTVRAINEGESGSPFATTRSVCVEGFNASDPNYVSGWSACNPVTHKRTRICVEDCGTNDCSSITTSSEDCLGMVRGTIFDASGMDVCPAFDPSTGYLTGLAGRGAANKTFGFADQNNVAPHPWAPLSPSVTDSSGNYSINVYAPANYGYDFSSLTGYYSVSSGPKLTCTSTIASVPDNSPTCLTQPCTIVKNMSFGFDKVFGGWWQAKGASVHAEGGITSRIPSSLPTEQSLILPETSPINQWGFLSYGLALPQMLGNNAGAKVSTMLWEKLSSYRGLIYDWHFYDNRFNLFTRTEWNGTDPTVYNDQGHGYQIFRTNSSVANFNFSPTGSEKVVFEVNGNITVKNNVTVPAGAFLAIIANGTITFDPAVTAAAGWYVGDRIAVPCLDIDGTPGCDKTDDKFLGSGSFIGWKGIDLSRDTGSLSNTEPSELFSYRRDLYTNAPDPLKTYTKYYKPFIP